MSSTFPPSSLPRERPVLRCTIEKAPYPLEPSFFEDRFYTKTRSPESRDAALWTAFDRGSGAVRIRGFLRKEQPSFWSAPGVGPGGEVGVLVYHSAETGIALHVFEPDGRPRSRWDTGFDFLKYETPDDYAGPGPMPAPVKGSGDTWIACASYSTQDHAPDRLECWDPRNGVRWRHDAYLEGTTEKLVIARDRRKFLAIDKRTGEIEWEADQADVWPTISEGVFVMRPSDVEYPITAIDTASGEVFLEVKSSGGANVCASAKAVLIQEPGTATIRLWTSGTLAGTWPLEPQLRGFDGVQMLCVGAENTLFCGPAAEPGAWRWSIPFPAKTPYAIDFIARDGWLCAYSQGDEKAWVFGPP